MPTPTGCSSNNSHQRVRERENSMLSSCKQAFNKAMLEKRKSEKQQAYQKHVTVSHCERNMKKCSIVRVIMIKEFLFL